MGFYEDLENKYYDLLDSLDKAGFSLYPLTDALDDNGIPSMPVMALLLLLLLGGLILGAATALGIQVFPSTTTDYLITVVGNDDTPIEGVSVLLRVAGKEALGSTNAQGMASLRADFVANEEPVLAFEKEGYEPKEEKLEALTQAPLEAIEKTVKLERKNIGFTTDAPTSIIIKQDDEDDVTIACEYACEVPFIEGAEYYDACGNKLSPNGGHITCSNPTLNLQGSGSVTATVVDQDTLAPIAGASVKVMSDFRRVKEGATDSRGVVTLTGISTGLYSTTVIAAGYVAKTTTTPPLSVADGELSSITIALQKTGTLPNGTPAAFNVTVVDSNGLVLQGAVIAYAPAGQPSNSTTVTTDGAGKASFNALNEAYNLTVSKPSYVTLNENNKTPGAYTFTLSKAVAGAANSLEVTVKHSDGSKAELAEVRIMQITGGSETFTGVMQYTDSNGFAKFNGFDLNADYKARAVKGAESAVSTVIRFTSPTQTLTGTLTLSTTPIACDNDGSCDAGEPSNCADCNEDEEPGTGPGAGGSEGSFAGGSGAPVPFGKMSVNWAHSDVGYSYTGTGS